MRLRRAAALAVVAGLLLIVANVAGGSHLLQLGDQLARALLPGPAAATAHVVFEVLMLIAGLGGVAVLLGGVFYAKGWVRPGNLFVALGAGVGVLGLIVLVLLALVADRGADLLRWLVGPAGVGVLLSIAARRAAK